MWLGLVIPILAVLAFAVRLVWTTPVPDHADVLADIRAAARRERAS
jgi:hypothetical protein